MFQPIADFDFAILDSFDSLDMSQADEMFAPERLATSANALGKGNRISMNDAQAQGIIGSVDD